MKKELIRTQDFIGEDDNNKRFELEYYLTTSEHPFKNSNINYLCYGTEIKMRCSESENYCETEFSDKIFSSKEVAIDFINKIADELVTPCTLKDVISDMLIEALG